MTTNVQVRARRFANRQAIVGIVAAAFMLVTQFIAPLDVHAASKAEIRVKVNDTLAEFPAEVRGANEVLRDAKGVLVFPDIYQAGFVLGGEYGKGALKIGSGFADYYRLIAGSLGWQLGGQKKSVVIAFMTDDALRKFREGSGWDLGADANATLITAGLEEQVRATQIKKPILVFVLDQKGLMAGATLKGLKISKL